MSVLIKNAIIVTQNEKREIKKGNIYIVGNEITEVGETEERAEMIIDAKGKVAIPGLINSHAHAAMTLLRGYGEGLELDDWLGKKIWPAEAKLTEESVYFGTMLGAAEMIRGGTTAFSDMYVKADGSCRAVLDSGMRGIIGAAMFDMLPGRSLESELKNGEDFIRKWKTENERLKVAVGCHAIYACSEQLLAEGKETADRHNIGFHIHMSETRKEIFDCLRNRKMRPFEYLEKLGLIDERSVFAHAVWVSRREIGLIGERGASVCISSVSNMKLATGGIAPVKEFVEKGANVTVGTDGPSSNNSLNMFETMKMTSLSQKHKYWQAGAVAAQEAFDFATLNGAKAVGINAGSIEEGKLADIALLDIGMPNLRPAHDLVANIVYAGYPGNVTHTIVNGKVLMEDRRVTAFDEGHIIDRAGEEAGKLIEGD